MIGWRCYELRDETHCDLRCRHCQRRGHGAAARRERQAAPAEYAQTLECLAGTTGAGCAVGDGSHQYVPRDAGDAGACCRRAGRGAESALHLALRALAGRARQDRPGRHRYADRFRRHSVAAAASLGAAERWQCARGQTVAPACKLVHAKVALGQSLSAVKELSSVRRQIERALARMIDRVDLLIVKAVSQDEQLAPLHRLLQTIVGVGPIVAAQLAQALTRMRWRNEDAFVAYTGLDPRPKDSGTHRGRRKLTKYGPPMLRHLLFMGAMSAIKTALYKPMYRALRDRGLETTQALVVVARRIARIAFAMFKTGEVFDPRRLSPAPQNA